MPEIHTKLKDIITEYPNILLDRQKLRSLLNDFFPNQKNTINVLLLLYFELKIHQEILEAGKTDIYFISRIASKLHRDYSIELEAAKRGVITWVNCLKERKIPENTITANNSLSSSETDFKGVYIPCGVGIHDHGFLISGMTESDKPCEHPQASIYAVIFGYLQRSLNMSEGIVYKTLLQSNKQNRPYHRIYRLQILILHLLKNNYFTNNSLKIAISGWTEFEIKLALECINYYAELICSLVKTNFSKLRIVIDQASIIKIGSSNTDGTIRIIDCLERKTKNREIWFESNITYSITSKDILKLKVILEEAFNCTGFLPGQFEALQNILNSDESKLCIMPTGSGKSLVYYLAAILQPCPTMVLSPTKILIQDQCDILINKHEIDDIQRLYEHENYEEFTPHNKLIFLTPIDFLSSDLIRRVIMLDIHQHISNFVLDEVHCISNWSHDFRPEYLMLSFNLWYFVGKTRLLCFTATANYTVVKDLHIQLKLNSEGHDIISPLDLKKSNQHFKFTSGKTEEEILSCATDKIIGFLGNDKSNFGKQLLIFTKKKNTSDKIWSNLPKEIQPHVEVFSAGNRNSYSDFASNIYQILLGDSDVGVGLNLPGVTDTYHYGVPVSKSQYVQEIGRAGRDKNHANSEVIFRDMNSLSFDQNLLLHRNTPITKIIEIIKNSEMEDDLTQSYRKIFGGIESPDEYLAGVLSLYKKILPIRNSGEVKLIIDKNKTYDECLFQYMRYLYVLYRVGYIFNWYIDDHNKEEGYVTFLIEISEHTDLDTLKAFTTHYLLNMGDYKKAVHTIKQSVDIEGIIENYISWHYNQFLYHHREQFMEMYDFLDLNKEASDEQISFALKEYFSLSLFDVKEDTTKFNRFTIKDINLITNQSLSDKVLAGIQKSMENEYSVKLDYLLFLYNCKSLDHVDVPRFERVITNLDDIDFQEVLGFIDQVYKNCDDVTKVLIINSLCKHTSLMKVLGIIYNKLDEDLVYYSIMSKCGNQNLTRSM